MFFFSWQFAVGCSIHFLEVYLSPILFARFFVGLATDQFRLRHLFLAWRNAGLQHNLVYQCMCSPYSVQRDGCFTVVFFIFASRLAVCFIVVASRLHLQRAVYCFSFVSSSRPVFLTRSLQYLPSHLLWHGCFFIFFDGWSCCCIDVGIAISYCSF